MNRINTLVGAALVAGSFVASSAVAADKTTGETSTNKADSTQVVPARGDLQPGAAPTVRSMDDNAQRQHDPDRKGGGAGDGAGTAAGQTSTNKADQTQVVPSRDDLQPGAAPTVESMDANAQRQHDRNRDGSAQGSSTGAAAGGEMAAASSETRDWSAIDTNNDNLISPEEMEAALKADGPQAAEPKR
ncbi:MAG: hypothetical protein H0W48_12930 [Methylibium sp.]|nr:hypothetical protein [Methylibium sp.]MBA3625327.1 hypothetical protein [Methylibium sp.]